MITLPEPYITPEEYLRLEKEAEFRSEYYRGKIFAMAGTSPTHKNIVTSLIAELYGRIKAGPC